MAGVRLGEDVAGGQVEQDLGEEPRGTARACRAAAFNYGSDPIEVLTAAGPRRLDALT